MPDFKVTLTTDQANAVSKAFGALLNGSVDTPATASQVIGWLKGRMREVVKAQRQRALAEAQASQVAEEIAAEEWEKE